MEGCNLQSVFVFGLPAIDRWIHCSMISTLSLVLSRYLPEQVVASHRFPLSALPDTHGSHMAVPMLFTEALARGSP